MHLFSTHEHSLRSSSDQAEDATEHLLDLISLVRCEKKCHSGTNAFVLCDGGLFPMSVLVTKISWGTSRAPADVKHSSK